MKTYTLKEVNRKFGEIAKAADKDGSVCFTKHGKPAYILMTKETYMERKGEDPMKEKLADGIWGKTNNSICRIKTKGDRVQILIMHIPEGETYPMYCEQMILPEEKVSLIDGDPMEIWVNEATDIKYAGMCPVEGMPSQDPYEKEVQEKMEKALREYEEEKPSTADIIFKGSKRIEILLV